MDNIEPWFFWTLLALAAIVSASIRFGRGIKPYDEGEPRTPGADYSDHFVCGVHGCHNPADGIHITRRLPMCDDHAIAFDRDRKERHRRNSA